MKKNKKKLKIILGDISYPKSDILIIPANTKGIMSRGRAYKIVQDGWKGIEKEAKKVALEEKVEIGECFTTEPGRLKRRGVKIIYHCVIKRFTSDYTSINILTKALKYTFDKILEEEFDLDTITICGIGIEPGDLDKKTVARITYKICCQYIDYFNIKIMDGDLEFINNVCEFFGEKNGSTK